ncbi:MAG: nucleotide sugar dehydrogenase [Thermodesulfovibrionales bacterium]|nr:nucleotide sugar dehydrogenase [Thermodesulfovibrionales bacterium]
MELAEKIAKKDAIVGIVGLGYVGLPLVVEFAAAGVRVLGFDIDADKTAALNSGRSYIRHIPSEKIAGALSRFEATTDYSRIGEVDAIVVCVPTPLDSKREPDLSYIIATTKAVATHLREGQLYVLESTTYPGTTVEVVKPILESGGLRAGEDFFLAYSPEREDPNNPDYSTRTIPKVVGGFTGKCLDTAEALYGLVVNETVPVKSPDVAEAAKLLENIYRSVNIALVNELKVLFDRMGLDVWEVIRAASTKPFGFEPFEPGPGLGGHCIPIDPFYLTWRAKQYGFETRFIELAGEINTSMPYYVVDKVEGSLRDQGISLEGSRILVLGLAYKRDVDDARESPSLKLIEIMEGKGAQVDYNDPYIPLMPKTRKYSLMEKKDSVELTAEGLASYDCVLVATDHSEYDPGFIAEHARLVVDTRNLIKDPGANAGKIRKA